MNNEAAIKKINQTPPLWHVDRKPDWMAWDWDDLDDEVIDAIHEKCCERRKLLNQMDDLQLQDFGIYITNEGIDIRCYSNID